MNMAWEKPTWAPDGQKLAATDPHGLYLLATDTAGPAVETLDVGLVASPDWSENGQWVAYTKWEDNHRLIKARPDGSETACLTSGSEDYSNPAWSPDGILLVCEKVVDDRYQLAVINAEIGDELMLTDDYYDNLDPGFSPDGQWIVFTKADHTGYSQVYKIRPWGDEETALTTTEANHRSPEVSPDGCWVVFTTWPTDEVSQFYGFSMVEVVELASCATTTLTDPDSDKEDPFWTDDSTVIYTEELPPDGTDSPGPRSGLRRLRVNLPRRAGNVAELPRKYELHQNVPNPFRRRTVIRYAVPTRSEVRLQVYDLTGRVVREMANGSRKPGYYNVAWDGRDNAGRELAAGVYFYELRADDRVMERKMLYLR